MMQKSSILFLLIFIQIFGYSYGQTEHQVSETSSSVPELFAFHDVIYPMWHTAYPDKDYAMLKELLPKIIEGAEKIQNAKLPGILRDKENVWKEGVDKFKSSAKNYEIACEKDDNDLLLKSTEELHSNFEMLVRIVKPVTKEVDEFHKVLYMIYHHYQPEKDVENLNKSIDDLTIRSEELKNCVLPKWASSKKDEFINAADKLYNSTLELKKLKDGKADDKQIEKGIDAVHSNYQKLESLFD
jgi:hypothetical protein